MECLEPWNERQLISRNGIETTINVLFRNVHSTQLCAFSPGNCCNRQYASLLHYSVLLFCKIRGCSLTYFASWDGRISGTRMITFCFGLWMTCLILVRSTCFEMNIDKVGVWCYFGGIVSKPWSARRHLHYKWTPKNTVNPGRLGHLPLDRHLA